MCIVTKRVHDYCMMSNEETVLPPLGMQIVQSRGWFVYLHISSVRTSKRKSLHNPAHSPAPRSAEVKSMKLTMHKKATIARFILVIFDFDC